MNYELSCDNPRYREHVRIPGTAPWLPEVPRVVDCKYQNCGVGFQRPRLTKYCSIACTRTASDLIKKKRREAEKQKRRRDCIQCGESFVPERNNIVLCSGKCRKERELELERKWKAAKR